MKKERCTWVTNELLKQYHDKEWGRIITDDQQLFEALVLETMQAGLSWNIVLNKRENYKNSFYNFDIRSCANLTDEYLELQRNNSGIIRNKLKIYSIRKNANAFIKIQKEYGSFFNYIWKFVNKTKINNINYEIKDIPTKTELSDIISKDMKKRGFSFVGSTIIYSYLQAIGIINDHLGSCLCYERCKE